MKASQSSSLRVDFSDDGASIGALGPVCLYLYRGPMTTVHVARGKQLHRAQQRLYPTGIVVLIAYRTDKYVTVNRSDNLRRELTDLVREANDIVKSTAVVIETLGFAGAAIRAAATGVTLLARPKFPLKYMATVREATEWMSQHARVAHMPGATEIADAIEQLARAPLGVNSAQ